MYMHKNKANVLKLGSYKVYHVHQSEQRWTQDVQGAGVKK